MALKSLAKTGRVLTAVQVGEVVRKLLFFCIQFKLSP